MNYRQLIESFNITSVDEVDGIITVFGEDDELVCEISLYDVLEKCPHGYGYTSDRHSDRAEQYRVETSEMWEDRSDRIGMVEIVWDEIEKKWINEDGEEIILPKYWEEMKTVRVSGGGDYPKTIQKTDDERLEILINSGFWIDSIDEDIIKTTITGECEIDWHGNFYPIIWLKHTHKETYVWFNTKI